jgi:hypothetical protein
MGVYVSDSKWYFFLGLITGVKSEEIGVTVLSWETVPTDYTILSKDTGFCFSGFSSSRVGVL